MTEHGQRLRCRSLGAAALSITLAALGLYGCGTSTLSARVLRQRADAACATASAREQHIPNPRQPRQVKAFLQRGIAVVMHELARLRRLDPNAADAPTFDDALDQRGGELEALRAAERRLDRGRELLTTIRALQATLTPLERSAASAWRKLEVRACLSG